MCEHIVQMIGYYESEEQQISIYEYMPGGTLEQRLHRGELLFFLALHNMTPFLKGV